MYVYVTDLLKTIEQNPNLLYYEIFEENPFCLYKQKTQLLP